MFERKIKQGKVPLDVVKAGTDGFASAENVVGARVTFIEQLRRSSKDAEEVLNTEETSENTVGGLVQASNSVYDSTSALYQKFIGNTGKTSGGEPRNFRQILSDARKSAE